ncbi:M4 family metallopeptidase [Nocardioides sp.]|uniref:M4 family metallopeptidase n=1 Tax=Nocardioides sp. TaxID=35761 RepID=UPI003518EDE9
MRLTLSTQLRRGVGLSLIGAAIVAVPVTSATTAAQAAPKDPSIVEQLRDAADGTVTATNSPATGRLAFVKASGDLFPSTSAARSLIGAQSKVDGYVDRFAGAFGATADQLAAGPAVANPAGYTVDVDQTYRGLPVFGAKLRAQVDRQGRLRAVSGFVAPKVDVATTPRLSKDDAIAKAISLATKAPAGAEGEAPAKATGKVEATKAELSIYRRGAIQGVEGDNLLAWVVEVTDGKQLRETTVLDAVSGKPVNRFSMIAHALDRELHEESIGDTPVWKEGDAFPGGLDTDQASEVAGTGEAYWLFKNTFGRDSYDGKGSKMITVNNDPSIACPNANWNGTSTNYCSGVSSDDTVAHEWGHAYTEYTSGLLYQWQPGAMNEAYSDIWGETVDMLNDRLNSPDEETKRTDGNCSKGTRGDIAVVVGAPVGSCTAAAASFGPIITHVENTLVVGKDAVEEKGSDTDGCSPFSNAAALVGKFVYVDRGGCTFSVKIDNAESAGAAGIIFGNNTAGVSTVSANSTLYGAMVSQADGTRIKDAATELPITLDDAATDPRDDSYRWLSGEDDPAFGGAIRDMWNPTCYGDPGKVSDEEYFCSTDDSGGVHSNSGVVNHAYALLVDGGTYNGVTVPGIGLDKAANIFWRTQTSYLTPTSGFAELADGLQSSCTDLIGNTSLKQVTLGSSATGGSAVDAPTMPAITDADCSAVAKVAQATELRVEPVQCNFRLLLRQGTIGCGEGTTTKKVFSEGFEGGKIPAGWVTDVEADNAHFDPKVTSELPINSKGGAAHQGGASVLYFADKGEKPSFGVCDGGPNDYSSRVGVATPALTVPAGSLPRLSFDHYVATEVSFDGGNVKVSVNGGAFTALPDTAWLFNAPAGQLDTVAEGNTNPMAGETAFTGTDGGVPTGSWGTSVIDLGEVAKAGDTVKFRFDFGMDGCGGVDGWYIDNITMSVCQKAVTTPPAPAASPAVVNPNAGARDGVVKVRIRVASGATPSGRVLLRIGSKLYTGRVSKGILAVPANPQLAKLYRQGVRRVPAVVRYDGDAKVRAFRAGIRITLKGRQ